MSDDEPALVMVTGSRAWREEHLVRAELDAARERFGPAMVLIHGDCPSGADRHAARWARERDVPARAYPPAPGSGRGGFLARNQAMVDARPVLVLAFLDPSSRGTWHAVTAALTAGREVRAVTSQAASEELVAQARAAAAMLVADGGWRSSRRRALAAQMARLQVGGRVPPGLAEAIEETLT